jgi:WD40 repeat protein
VFSLNGDTLISGSGSSDNIVCLWDMTSGYRRAVNRNIPGYFRGITRGMASEDVYVVSNLDGSTTLWKIIDEGDRCRAVPPWINATGGLRVTGASVQGIRGLSQVNKKLLKQRGAEGEPESQLLEASKKVIAMASVMSKLKQSTGQATLDISNTDLPDEQPGSQDGQTRDS